MLESLLLFLCTPYFYAETVNSAINVPNLLETLDTFGNLVPTTLPPTTGNLPRLVPILPNAAPNRVGVPLGIDWGGMVFSIATGVFIGVWCSIIIVHLHDVYFKSPKAPSELVDKAATSKPVELEAENIPLESSMETVFKLQMTYSLSILVTTMSTVLFVILMAHYLKGRRLSLFYAFIVLVLLEKIMVFLFLNLLLFIF